MIIALLLVPFVVAALLIALSSTRKLPNHILYLMAGMLVLIAGLGMAEGYLNYSSPQILSANIISNTIYQNTNYSMMTLYATGNNIAVWLGNSSTSMFSVGEGSSVSVQVPHLWYFKLNFSSANTIEVND